MKIRNRSASVVGYTIPDLHVHRRFSPGEIKEISKEEIEQLLYQPGGRAILTDYLQVSQDDIKEIDMEEQEKEYYYTEDEIKKVITSGSIDEFLDMLDFAPEGVINLVKNYATSLPMTDLYKIQALKDKTGFDASKALEHLKEVDDEPKAEAPKRRVTENKYKIITEN